MTEREILTTEDLWQEGYASGVADTEAAFIEAARRIGVLEDLSASLRNAREGKQQGRGREQGESDSTHYGLPPIWQALQDGAQAFETWYGPPRLGINAWVGVSSGTNELYGGWAVEGDHLYDEWDESEMMTASGSIPEEVIGELLDIAERYRARRDAERRELEEEE